MTLTQLYEDVCNSHKIPSSRTKDLKTSVRYLARALGAESPDTITDAETLGGRYHTSIRTYFTSLEPQPSIHTLRNTLNNLNFLFRMAQTYKLISAFTPRPERKSRVAIMREADRTSPYRERMNRRITGSPYMRPPHCWPAVIQGTWTQYCNARCLEVRPITLKLYQQRLEQYIGYSLTMETSPVKHWKDIFDTKRLGRFIQWHTQRVGASRITANSYDLVRVIQMLARYYDRPEFPAIQALMKKLPTPEPMHNKQHPTHVISLKELEDVGLTLLTEAREGLVYQRSRFLISPGLQSAIRHQMGLILRLMVRVPLRNRNIREMQLGRNLYQDLQGTWQIQFQGEDLKVRERSGRINTFQVPFPPDLREHLEEFLQVYRPRIPNSDANQHIFLSYRGGCPYTQSGLASTLSDCVMARLGKRFYPHLIRTLYTDTYLLQTHDVSTAAFMLNDRPETVLKRYHELRANDHITKAHTFTQRLFSAQAPIN